MRKYITRILSCALVLGVLSTAALAAEMTIPSGDGSVTLSDVVSTEDKTVIIDGEQREVTIHYITDGSAYQLDLGGREAGTFNWYVDVGDGFAHFGAGTTGTEGTIQLADFPFGSDSLGTLTVDVGGEVYFMLDGKQGAGAVLPGSAPAEAPAAEKVTLETAGEYSKAYYGSLAVEGAAGGTLQHIDMKNLSVEGRVYRVSENAKATAEIVFSYGDGCVVNLQYYVPGADGNYERVDYVLLEDGTFHPFDRSKDSFFSYALNGTREFTLPSTSYFMVINIGEPMEFGVAGDVYYLSMGDVPASEPAGTSAPADAAPAETAPAETTGGASYTVVKYDTLGQISLNNYGSYKYHTALYKANADAFKATGGKLVPGMTLILPDTLGAAKRVGMPAAGEGETLYTVKAGDTLGGIAKTVYGDVMMYQAIFERNADRLTNANTIYEGQVIVLPAK